MVASGIGVTVLPSPSVPAKPPRDSLLAYVPFARPVPARRVVLVYRKTFPRLQAIEALRQAVLACELNGVQAPTSSQQAATAPLLSRPLSVLLIQSIGLIVGSLLFCGRARCIAAPTTSKGDDHENST